MRPAIILLIIVCGFVPVSEPTPHQSRGSQFDTCGEVRQALDDSLQIHIGTTRREVEKRFKEDGGATTREQTRYIFKKCAYIQIEIYFKLAAPRNSLNFSPNDIVIKVSKPYLAYPAAD
jgi:hypothetical protein